MLRSTFAHIDLDAIAANYRAITAFLAAESPGGSPPSVIAVVKANAYGHGAGPVARALEQAGAGMLACADIEEAVALRTAGVRAGILVFGAMSVSDLGGLFEHDLVPTISTPTAARAVEAEAARRATRIRYHLKIDTGMHRLGFRHDSLRQTLPELLASPHLQLAAVYTHFATAEDPEHPLMERQRAASMVRWRRWPSMGVPRVRRHAANSAAMLRDSRVWFDAVRPGLLLYGVPPPPLATTVPVRPGDAAGEPCRLHQGSACRRIGGLRRALHGRAAATDRGGARRICRRARSAARRARSRARRRTPRADRGLRLDGHDHHRRHGRALCAG